MSFLIGEPVSESLMAGQQTESALLYNAQQTSLEALDSSFLLVYLPILCCVDGEVGGGWRRFIAPPSERQGKLVFRHSNPTKQWLKK